jgi:flavodoxin
MKKILFILLMTAMLLFTVCAQGTNTGNKQTGENMKILVAYFSHTGTTEKVAKYIHSLKGGTLFEIKTVNPYPSDYNACLTIATEELRSNSRPQLSTHVNNIDAYDIIFIGYPIWWGDSPMAIRTFIEEYDFSNKTIIPFCTSGSSGITTSIQSIRQLSPKSKILDGLCITNANRSRTNEMIEQWINKLEIK